MHNLDLNDMILVFLHAFVVGTIWHHLILWVAFTLDVSLAVTLWVLGTCLVLFVPFVFVCYEDIEEGYRMQVRRMRSNSVRSTRVWDVGYPPSISQAAKAA